MLALLAQAPAGKAIDPTAVARALGGDHPGGWGPLMHSVRRTAIRLMKEGSVVILRKGRPVDPDNFRGIYRLASAYSGQVDPAGRLRNAEQQGREPIPRE
jgi:hypothetical protein